MIDLRSDTVTRPTAAMREAAATAEVGDDVFGEDPTVTELESTAAKVLGKDAALFVPSGTMGNQIAALALTTSGEEVILESNSHLYNWEVGGLVANAGLQPRPLDGTPDGWFSPDQLQTALIEESLHQAGTGLVTVENTHNHAGGVPHDRGEFDTICEIAHDAGISVHLDGARLMNAAVALERSPATLAGPADTVMLALSKGLGAPVGSILAGEENVIAKARRYRKRLGGGMRQAGIIAGPALVALDDWDHLEGDHRRARKLASGLDTIPGLSVEKPQTNIVLASLTAESPGDAQAVIDRCADAGVGGVVFGERLIRFCTHYDIADQDIETAITRIRTALTENRGESLAL